MQINLILSYFLAPNLKISILTGNEDIVCTEQTEDPPITSIILFERKL